MTTFRKVALLAPGLDPALVSIVVGNPEALEAILGLTPEDDAFQTLRWVRATNLVYIGRRLDGPVQHIRCCADHQSVVIRGPTLIIDVDDAPPLPFAEHPGRWLSAHAVDVPEETLATLSRITYPGEPEDGTGAELRPIGGPLVDIDAATDAPPSEVPSEILELARMLGAGTAVDVASGKVHRLGDSISPDVSFAFAPNSEGRIPTALDIAMSALDQGIDALAARIKRGELTPKIGMQHLDFTDAFVNHCIAFLTEPTNAASYDALTNNGLTAAELLEENARINQTLRKQSN